MLKGVSSQKSWLASVAEKLVHPSWLRSAVMRLPFDQIRKGSLNLNYHGQSYRFAGEQEGVHAELVILQPLRAYWLMRTQGVLGFAQAYYEGAVDTNSLENVLRLGIDNREEFAGLMKVGAGAWKDKLLHRKRHNSLQNSPENIAYHYDLGNAFYQKWLDQSMTYSSALFTDDEVSFEQAQAKKYQRILDEIGELNHSSILEIGCGWGGFMDEACAQGANVKGLTLSQEQQNYAMGRLQSAGYENFEVALQDYRLETNQYDAIVSIEMFEAVGKEYWDEYFTVLHNALKPGGKAVLQIITIDDEVAEEYQQQVDFIQKYIFPGGLLPSLQQLYRLAEKHGFVWQNSLDFGQDYAKTCQLWKRAFNHQSKSLEALGYDKAFQRLWNYYLDYCYVGFDVGRISVVQITLQKPLNAQS